MCKPRLSPHAYIWPFVSFKIHRLTLRRSSDSKRRPCFTALESAFPGALFAVASWRLFLNLPGSHPHDVDGVADNIGGAFLALGSLGHGGGLTRDRRGRNRAF